MNWIIKLLKRVARGVRIIPDRIDPNKDYLERGYLIGKRDHERFVMCLHRLLCSDPTDPHDHPANYFSMVLKGGYWEHTPAGSSWRGPGHFRFRKAEDLHRIEIDPKVGPATTLFIMFKRKRNWGFVKDGVWIDHDTYLDQLKRDSVCRSSSTSRPMAS